jgi:hypothetical protein
VLSTMDLEKLPRPALDSVLSSLDTRSALALRGYSTCFQRELGDLRWNSNTLFCRFVSDPWAFRCKLRETDAVVAGGLATQFLAREIWPGSGMDVFVGFPEGTLPPIDFVCPASGSLQEERSAYRGAFVAACVSRANILLKYFQEEEGYFAVERTNSAEYANAPWERIGLERDGQVVQVIWWRRWESDFQTVPAVLQTFFSTAVMNFITWQHAVSVFPHLTFVDREMIVFPASYVSGRVVDRYVWRGWPVRHYTGAGEGVTTIRVLGDKHCCLLQFSESGWQEPCTELSFPACRFVLTQHRLEILSKP